MVNGADKRLTWVSPCAYTQVAGSAPSHHALIVMGHNGPSGLGDRAHDICGVDWVAKGGDHGDPDLQVGGLIHLNLIVLLSTLFSSTLVFKIKRGEQAVCPKGGDHGERPRKCVSRSTTGRRVSWKRTRHRRDIN